MSEFNPFGNAPEQQEVALVEEVSEGRDKKVLLALGGVAALALAAGAYLFLGGSGEEELDSFAAPVAPAAAAPVATPSPQAQLPVATSLQLGRSPFEVKYIAPAPVAAAPQRPSAPSTGSTDGASGVIVIPVGPGGSTGTTGGGGTGGGTAEPAPSQPKAQQYKLILLRVFGEGPDQSASFSIDGREQTAKVGSTFGPTAEIMLVELTEGPEAGQWTASLLVGEERVDARLGETIYVP